MGMVIAEQRSASPPSERLALLEPSLQAAALQARQLGITDDDALSLFERLLAGRDAVTPSIKEAASNDEIPDAAPGTTP
jgi:DNA-binding transcriptional regulator YhcF (GntR family)